MGRPDVIAAFVSLLREALIKSNLLGFSRPKTLVLEYYEPGSIFPFVKGDTLSRIRFARKNLEILKIRDLPMLSKKKSARNELLRAIQKADVVVAPYEFMDHMRNFAQPRRIFGGEAKAWGNVQFGRIYSIYYKK